PAGPRVAVDLDMGGPAGGRRPRGAGPGPGDGEPEGLGPAGAGGGGDPLQHRKRPNDRAFLDGGEPGAGHRRLLQEAGSGAGWGGASSRASKARVARAAASGSPSSRLAWWKASITPCRSEGDGAGGGG